MLSVRVLTVAATLAVLLTLGRTAVAPHRPPQRRQVPSLFTEAPGEAAPELAALLAPAGTPEGTYAAYVTPDALTRVIAWYRREKLITQAAWSVEPLPARDLFGVAAPVDRWKLARLFGGRRPAVARAPLVSEGRVLRSITLVSPYPSADLDRLLNGTLVLVFRVPSDAARSRRYAQEQ